MFFDDLKYFTIIGNILPNCLLYCAHDIGYYIYDLKEKKDIVSFPLDLSKVKTIFHPKTLQQRLIEYNNQIFTDQITQVEENWLADRASRLIKLEILL